MGAPLFSLSGTERVDACPASAALDQVHTVTDDGARGTALHEYAKHILQGMPRAQALARIPAREKEWLATAANFNPKDVLIGMGDVRAEVSYAIHAPTGSARELGVDLGRNYLVTDGEIPGSVDVEGTNFEDQPVIVDWKTGHDDVTGCAENLQLLGYAYAIAEIRGASSVDARIIYIRPEGRSWTDRHVFSRFELDAFGDLLKLAYDRVVVARTARSQGAPMNVAIGPHCRYCPAMPACSAQTALARSMVTDLEAVHSTINALTPEMAGQAWLKLAAIKNLVAAVDESLKTMAKQRPIPLGSGKELRELSFEAETFSQDAAIAMLHRKGASLSEIASLRTKSMRTQVRALKARSF